MKFKMVFIGLLFIAFQVVAFEKKEISFENESNPAKKVYFGFNGEIFDPPLDLGEKPDAKKSDIQPDIKKIFQFFQKFYNVNKNGTKQDLLMLWNPSERSQLEKDIDNEIFKKNQARFNAIIGMKLKMIIEYGNFYICYIAMEFSDHKIVMKYPLLLSKKGMFLSNQLNGDYFYDAISHFLDKENYKNTIGQFVK